MPVAGGRRERFFGQLLNVAITRKDASGPDIKIVVTKKLGGAVKRNRIKRVIKEALRGLGMAGVGAEIFIYPLRAEAGESPERARQDLAKTFKNAGLL